MKNGWLYIADTPTEKRNKHATLNHCRICCANPAVIVGLNRMTVEQKVEEPPLFKRASFVLSSVEVTRIVFAVAN